MERSRGRMVLLWDASRKHAAEEGYGGISCCFTHSLPMQVSRSVMGVVGVVEQA